MLKDMRKEIEIPKGCKKITIDVEGERLIVTYSSSINNREFLCDETGEMEELPKVGDFAILWNDMNRSGAIVGNVAMIHPEYFRGVDNYQYGRAIKFRNYEQYLKIRGIYGEDQL